MSDVVVRTREVLISFGLKISRARLERGSDWVPSEEERAAMLGEACSEQQLSEEHLAEVLQAVPELAEWYVRACEFGRE